MVPGTSSFRERALNHSLAECFWSAYRALMPARIKSNGMKKGYRMYITTSWYWGHSGYAPKPPMPPKTPLLL